MKKVKVSIVSYLNTTPLVYGLEHFEAIQGHVELSKDIPSECARKLASGEVDLGLIPVAAISSVPNAEIISDYCIGAEGKVKSVLLVSEVPLQEIESIYLDFHSRTSIQLCQVLCKEHWKIAPKFVPAKKGFEQLVSENTAAVIIGDRTFHFEKEFKFQFDLAEEWEKMNGLPFVFAAWVSSKKLEEDFIILFNSALAFGLKNKELSINSKTDSSISKAELEEYLSKYIKFNLDDNKRKAMNLFLSKLRLSTAIFHSE